MPSYEKSKSSGLWSCRFREMGADKIIHNMRLSGYKTKREAQFAYEDYIKEADERRRLADVASRATSQNEITIADLCRKYLSFQKSRVKESSYVTFCYKAEGRIIPFFQKIRICDATPDTIQQWLEYLGDVSYTYKKDLYRLLYAICHYGMDYFDTADFMRKVRPPRNTERKKEMQVWSVEQFYMAIEHEENAQFRALYVFLYFTGCRKGEALALEWRDIDLSSGVVTINKNMTIKTGGAGYKITSTKNEYSDRKIKMPPVLVDELIRHRKTCGKQRFVFGGDAPLMTEAVRRHLIADAQAAGLEPIRIHDLRHSHASYLISCGVPITAVSKRLGHSTVQQTLQTYSHVMPDDQTVLDNALKAIKIGTK